MLRKAAAAAAWQVQPLTQTQVSSQIWATMTTLLTDPTGYPHPLLWKLIFSLLYLFKVTVVYVCAFICFVKYQSSSGIISPQSPVISLQQPLVLSHQPSSVLRHQSLVISPQASGINSHHRIIRLMSCNSSRAGPTFIQKQAISTLNVNHTDALGPSLHRTQVGSGQELDGIAQTD